MKLHHDSDDDRARQGRAYCPACGNKMKHVDRDPECGMMLGYMDCTRCEITLNDGEEGYLDYEGNIVDMRAIKRADRMTTRAADEAANQDVGRVVG